MRSTRPHAVHPFLFVARVASIACASLAMSCGTSSESSLPPADGNDQLGDATASEGLSEASAGDTTQPEADRSPTDVAIEANDGPDAGPNGEASADRDAAVVADARGDASQAGPDANAEAGADAPNAGADAAQPGPDATADTGADASHAGPDASPPGDSGGDATGTGLDADASGAEDAGGGPEMCTTRTPIDATTWKLAWSDEFDKPGAPDPSNWGFEQGFVRNQELQWYQPDNATVEGGLLTIAAQRQQVANPNYVAGSTDWTKNRQYAQYTSSSMTTSGKRSFLYGRFEMCGKIDVRLGSWPAFWILGNGKSWPASGEVDIMEYYANEVRANVCKPSGSTCDWSGSVGQALSTLGGTTWANEYHLWAMEWDTSHIGLYLDDELVYDFVITSAYPAYTGTPFYMLVNLAIGANGGDPTNTTFPITYQVDYVRVYQH
jgi:beta-glucanase (GH16 family)